MNLRLPPLSRLLLTAATRPLLLLLVALLVGGLVLPGAPASAVFDPPGQLLVGLGRHISIRKVNARYGTTTLLALADKTTFLVATPTRNTTMEAMRQDTRLIKWVDINASVQQPGVSDEDSGSDSFTIDAVASNGAQQYNNQWAVARIQLAAADSTKLGQGVTIAILDTTIDRGHPALAGKTLNPIDLVAFDPQANGPTSGQAIGHGTFVAGIVLRVAPQAKILPIRVLNDDGAGSSAIVAEGIRQAVNRGAQVINLSLTASVSSQALQDAVGYAIQKGVIVVAATGNTGLQAPAVYPANYSGVLAVGATNSADKWATFSNYGSQQLFAAPGVDVVSPWKNGGYGRGSGTSFASPWVAGEAALLWSTLKAPKSKDVLTKLSKGLDDISSANSSLKIGGRINIKKALAAR